MARKILLFILLVYSKFLFSAEVTLRSEDIFVCDILEETSTSILILYQEQKYNIPKTDILAVNTDILGKHTSYRNTIIIQKDGVSVKGILAEETSQMITLKKGDDYLAVPKDSIAEIKKTESKLLSLPDSYKVKEKEKKIPEWVLGFYGLGFKNTNRIGETNYASYGGGLFIEPSFLRINDRLIFGFQSEYLFSEGIVNYSFFQNVFYLNLNYFLFGQNFYSKLGVGTSYITLIESGQAANAFKALSILELGWQTTISEKYIIRVGFRGNAIIDQPQVIDMLGFQVSFGFRL